jgi:hypothetical protein
MGVRETPKPRDERQLRHALTRRELATQQRLAQSEQRASRL